MPTPGIVVGQNMLAPPGLEGETQGRFFSSFPGATPKYALNQGPRRSEFTETMARLAIVLPGQRAQQLLRSLPSATAAAAQTLIYGGDVTAIRDGNASGAGYFDFLLTSVQQQQQEREQAVDTLTDNTVIFYSGQSAPVLSCSGFFLNTFQNDQNVWFQLLYHDLLRGSALARRNLVVRFRYDSFFYSGYLMNLNINTEGGAKDYVQFSFNFRVKQIQIATPILYNPTLAQSLRTTNALVAGATGAGDDVTRHGVETAEQPMTPLAVPAASAAAETAEVDSRELAATQGVPPREVQAERDAVVVAETTATATAPEAAAEVVASGPAPSGDLREEVRASVGAALQDYREAPAVTPETADAVRELLGPQSTRGTTLVPNQSSAPLPAGTIATGVSRAAAGVEGIRPTPAPGAAQAPAQDAQSQTLQDVYRPTGALLQELKRSGGDASNAQVTRRTRQRPTA